MLVDHVSEGRETLNLNCASSAPRVMFAQPKPETPHIGPD